MKYRSRVDIVATMLQSAVGGATKTKLMYSAFLSHSQVEEYLEFLLGKRLVSVAEDEARKRFTPTEKGLRFLKLYDKIKDTVTVSEEEETATKRQEKSPEGDGLDEAIQQVADAVGEQAAGLRSGRAEA